MRKLDRSRDFGTFKGDPFIPPGCDRIALYTQDGRHFDAHDREIVAGESVDDARATSTEAPKAALKRAAAPSPLVAPPASAPAQGSTKAEPSAEILDVAQQLLASADKLPLALLKNIAGPILGAGCPAKKAEIVAALKARIAAIEDAIDAGAKGEEPEPALEEPAGTEPDETGPAPAQKPAEHKGVSFGSLEEAPPKVKPKKEPPAPAKAQPPAVPAKNGSAGVDLAAWARGRKDYVFGEVRKAIDARYFRSLNERREAVEFLIDQGVITAAEARKDV